MVFSNVGFDNNVAEGLKRNRDSSTTDDEICSMIQSRVKQLRRHSNEGDELAAPLPNVDQSFTLGRRLVIKPNRPVEPEVLLGLKQLQETDEETAQVLLARTPIYQHDGMPDITQFEAMNRCAVRVLVEEETDILTQQLGCAPPNNILRPEAVKLFEQFFEVCQRPNAAEIALLARVGTTDAARVTGWFNEKRERVKPLFIARAVNAGNGPAARYLRRERLGQGQRETQKPKKLH